jgi:hypothetical protein
MLPVCDLLVDNADRLGRLIYRRSPRSSVKYSTRQSITRPGDPDWRKDPELLTNAELILECERLEALIRRQTADNNHAREDLAILDPAVRRYDIEKQFVYIELMSEETGLLSRDGWRRNPRAPP